MRSYLLEGGQSMGEDPFQGLDTAKYLDKWLSATKKDYEDMSLGVICICILNFVFSIPWLDKEQTYDLPLQQLYEGDEEAFLSGVRFNLAAKGTVFVFGIINLVLVRKFSGWRKPVVFVNTACVALMMPPYITVPLEFLIFTAFPVHIFHQSFMAYICETTWQVVGSTSLLMLYDNFIMMRLKNDHKIEISLTNQLSFTIIYFAFCCIFGVRNYLQAKRAFLSSLVIESLNSEYEDLFTNFDDGLLICQKEDTGLKIHLANSPMKHFLDRSPTSIDDQLFRVYQFEEGAQGDQQHFQPLLRQRVRAHSLLKKDSRNPEGCKQYSLSQLIDRYFSSDKVVYFEADLSTSEGGESRPVVVQIKFRRTLFSGEDCLFVKITNINHIITSEHTKAKAAYQEALTATISHEQMTPLNSILSLTEYLLSLYDHSSEPANAGQAVISAEFQNTLKVIYWSSQQLKLMNQSILDLQAIKNGNFRLTFHKSNPIELLEEMVESFQVALDCKMIETSLEVEEAVKLEFPDSIMIDKERFQEIIYHLLSNAIKFNKESGGFIGIILSFSHPNSRAAGSKLFVTIKNYGSAMTDGQIDGAFETFANVLNPVRRGQALSSSGIGLGISTASQLAEEMNGSLKVSSTQAANHYVQMEEEGTQIELAVEYFEVYKEPDEYEQVREAAQQQPHRFSAHSQQPYFGKSIDLAKQSLIQRRERQRLDDNNFHEDSFIRSAQVTPRSRTVKQISKVLPSSAQHSSGFESPRVQKEQGSIELTAEQFLPNREVHLSVPPVRLSSAAPKKEGDSDSEVEFEDIEFIDPSVVPIGSLSEITRERVRDLRIEEHDVDQSRPAPCSGHAEVMIVDDNPFNLMPLKMLLTNRFKLSIVEAINGAQAVEKFVEQRNAQLNCLCGKGIKLVFMDINMPIMDGCTATEHILKFQQTYLGQVPPEQPQVDVQVVALTSYTNKKNIESCFRAGMKAVSHKPISADKIQDVMQKYFH